MIHEIGGVNCAAATPLTADGAPDFALFTRHCAALLTEGCHGLAILGTTGEANSFSVAERQALLESALASGIRGDQLLPGTTACNLPETIALTRHAVQAGAKGCLLLPPFYFKGVSTEGLYRFYAGVIEGVADPRLRIILYHIPQTSQVPITHDLIERLMTDFPTTVVGLKDSSGDPANLAAMAERFPRLGVLVGADALMLPLLRMGGAGCITGTANLRAADLRTLWDLWADSARESEVSAAQDSIVAWRKLAVTYPMQSTIKAMLARTRGNLGWLNLRPPLVALNAAECAVVWEAMARLGS